MPNRIRLFCVFLYLTAISNPALAAPKSVTVMADNTIGTAVAEIARNYSRDMQVVVNTSFAAPSAQEVQITEGGAADVLITPKQQWIDDLKMRGLVDVYSQTLVAKNQLALVGPADSPMRVNLSERFPVMALLNTMGSEQAFFVVGNPETQMAGSYGKEALRSMGVADDLEPYTLYIRRLDQMVDMVINQRAYGIFLYSSTISREGLRVLDLFPAESHRPIDYYAVVIAGDNMDEARKFLEYLKRGAARRVLRDNGFIVD